MNEVNGDQREFEFAKGLEETINRYSRENGSNTPDFILADYLVRCLRAFDAATQKREQWYGRATAPATEPVDVTLHEPR